MAWLQQARTQAVNGGAAAREASSESRRRRCQRTAPTGRCRGCPDRCPEGLREQQAETTGLLPNAKRPSASSRRRGTWSAAAVVTSGGRGGDARTPGRGPRGKPHRRLAPWSRPWETGGDGNNPSVAVGCPTGCRPSGPDALWCPVRSCPGTRSRSSTPSWALRRTFQVTQQPGKKFLQTMGILKPTDTGITNGGGIPLVYGNQAIEYVIKRRCPRSACRIPGAAATRPTEPRVSMTAPTPSASTAQG